MAIEPEVGRGRQGHDLALAPLAQPQHPPADQPESTRATAGSTCRACRPTKCGDPGVAVLGGPAEQRQAGTAVGRAHGVPADDRPPGLDLARAGPVIT